MIVLLTINERDTMKLRVIKSIDDQDYRDVTDKVYEYDLSNEMTLREVVEHHFRVHEDFDDEEIENFRDMLETGRWCGGEWIDEGNRIVFNTDIGWSELSILN